MREWQKNLTRLSDPNGEPDLKKLDKSERMADTQLGLPFVLVTCVLLISVTKGAPGTTLNIQRIFIGRCFEYQELSRGKIIEPRDINCTELWSIFLKAWAFRDPWSIVRTDYDNFFDAAQQTNLPKDKVLLWSGTRTIAHEYSSGGTRYVTLEDSLIGYLVNGLTWCGMVCDQCDGINFDECPDFQEDSSKAFWGGASATFAKGASGEVRVMLNGTNTERPAYSKESFFSQFELPALSTDVQLQVILVNELDKIPLEHCNTESLTELRKDVENRGMAFYCIENPLDVVHLLCVDDSTDNRCMMKSREKRNVPLPKLLSSHVHVQ